MPKAFEDCRTKGGRVRTKTGANGESYLHICFPPGGGPGVAGFVHYTKHAPHRGVPLTAAHYHKQKAECPLVKKKGTKKEKACVHEKLAKKIGKGGPVKRRTKAKKPKKKGAK